MGTRGQWSKDFLLALGNTNPSASVVNLVAAWTKAEGTKARYNPLATTLNLAPNTKFNSVGVRNYETRQQGIQASVQTLQGNFNGYKTIVRGLVTNDAKTALMGMHQSPWGTNFGNVERMWSRGDVTGEMLLSEEIDTNNVVSQSNAPNIPKPPPDVGNEPYVNYSEVQKALLYVSAVILIVTGVYILYRTISNVELRTQ